jgi:pre-mRNA-processing factor SLU7
VPRVCWLPREQDRQERAQKSMAEQHLEKLAAGEVATGSSSNAPAFSKQRIGEQTDKVALDRNKVKAALEAERKRKALNEDDAWSGTKKSKTDVTEEEMEAYRLSRTENYDDPMANYKDEEL